MTYRAKCNRRRERDLPTRENRWRKACSASRLVRRDFERSATRERLLSEGFQEWEIPFLRDQVLGVVRRWPQ